MTAPASPQEGAAALRRRAWLLCLMAALSQAGSYLYLAAMPAIAAEFGTGEAALQGTVTAFLAGSCLCFAVYGPLADRLGHRQVFAAATLLYAAASALAAVAPDLGALVAARFVQGIGASAGLVTARAMVRVLMPPDRATEAMALLSAVLTLAPAIGPLAGAALLAVADWRAAFLVAAIPGGASLLAGLAVLPPRIAGSVAPGARAAARAMLGSRNFLATLAILMATNAVFSVLVAASPFVFVESLGLSPVAYATLFGMVLVGFAAAATLSGRIAARIGSGRVIRATLVPAAVAALATAAAAVLAPAPWTLGPALLCLMVSMGFVVPNTHVIMLMPFGTLAGTATGLALLITTATGALVITAYGIAAAGSIAGFGLSLAALALLVPAAFALLPAGAGDGPHGPAGRR
ncbi:MAG: MFS transporter [Rhodobacteraceae bacterium]|jgi:DHA1 family bicyclomycin/chloramphenicol resistance-like MFS transporter|nr:MFS transporter [Paracoccaceae bacterium]